MSSRSCPLGPWPSASLSGLAAIVALVLSAGAAGAADGHAIATGGSPGGAVPCTQCHGENGAGNRDSGFPRLAGLDAGYLVHELVGFAGGTRKNDIMTPIATALTPEEREAVARYYAGLPPVAPSPPPSAQPGEAAHAAERLATIGEWSKGLPACGACHGHDGGGVGATFPALAGQPADYLAAQIDAWRDGKRSDDPLGLMKGIAGKLSPEEIQAISAYYAALPIGSSGRRAGAQP